ncbi:hypothetical protein GW17_00035133 [Ensete ventricosum]|nr:hypothetical protein GW17_00035133 [Ensete ventricosum]
MTITSSTVSVVCRVRCGGLGTTSCWTLLLDSIAFLRSRTIGTARDVGVASRISDSRYGSRYLRHFRDIRRLAYPDFFFFTEMWQNLRNPNEGDGIIALYSPRRYCLV